MTTEARLKKNLMHNYTEKQRGEVYELVLKVKEFIGKDDYNNWKGGEKDVAINGIIDIADKYNLKKGLVMVLPNFIDDSYGDPVASYDPLENIKIDNNYDEAIRYYLNHISDYSQLPTSIFMEFILRYNSDPKGYMDRIITRLKEIYPWDDNGKIKEKFKDGWYYGSYYKTEFVDG